MKQCKAKVIRLTMTLFLAVCLMLNVVGPQIMAYQGEPAIAWKAPDEIVIDGSLEDWNRTSPITLAFVEQVFRDANQWFGETDLSADVYVMWDVDNLYVAALVKDFLLT